MKLRFFEATKTKTIYSLIVSFLFLIFLITAVANILPGASLIRMTVQIDHEDRFQIFYANNIKKKPFKEKYSQFSKLLPKGQKQNIRFKVENHSVARLRLDPGKHSGSARIYQIVIHSRFAKTVVLDPNDIYRIFRPTTTEVDVQLKDGYVAISSQQEDPQLIAVKPPIKNNIALAWGVPLIATLFLFIWIQRFDFSQFPPIYDIHKKKPATGETIHGLDGLRSLAMLMVVADHTWGRFSGLGAGGVWIFMSLSGFLLAKPFIDHPERMFSLDSLRTYILRRLARIIPAYYVYLVVIFILNSRFDDALRHALFLQGDGHLWVIPQLMLLYLAMPAIMAVNHFLLKNRPWPVLGLLTLMMVLSNRFLSTSVFSLYGMDHQNLRLFAGVFLSGIIFSYLYYQIYQPMTARWKGAWQEPFFALATFILIMFFLLGSTERLWGGRRIFAQVYFQWFGIAAGALLFSVLASQNSWINRILSWAPLRTISVVSYSFYLFHPLVLNCIRKSVSYYYDTYMVGFPLFITTVIGSYIVACLTYTFIEHPFLNSHKNNH